MLHVILADDHRIFRDALRELLEGQGGIEVVGETDNGAEVVGLVLLKKPDLVIMDVNIPSLNGMEATREIMRESPDTKVVCLSMHGEERFVRAMFDAGAMAYLSKDCAVEELTGAIQKAMAGEKYINTSLRVNMDGPPADQADVLNSAFAVLTNRERQITQMYSEGATTKAIADVLNISEKTVGTHRSHVMEKLNISGIVELTKYAVQQGLTEL
jgi:DNA-binding NarL/FixJ family response regulator